ncbi:MAG: DsbE family thiol:disulfide interchange protein [Rhodospirillaceae bacterium]
MKKLIYLVPIVVLAALAVMFTVGLGRDPKTIPSVLIDRPVPSFALEALPDRGKPLSSTDLTGQVTLVNIFGSWCVACIAEHPILVNISKTGEVPIHGIAWREKDPRDAMRWLGRHGDPYDRVGHDADSRVAIDFGVTGAPETFVVDPKGVIRYKHIGPVTTEVWENTLKPLIAQLRKSP